MYLDLVRFRIRLFVVVVTVLFHACSNKNFTSDTNQNQFVSNDAQSLTKNDNDRFPGFYNAIDTNKIDDVLLTEKKEAETNSNNVNKQTGIVNNSNTMTQSFVTNNGESNLNQKEKQLPSNIIDSHAHTPSNIKTSMDIDGDGVYDHIDAFPNNPKETVDSDNDGVGDNTDAFPNDPLETQDTDDDGVGDNADAFPNDPLETQDTDDDGVGDNSDAFSNDPIETQDTDDDGVGDNADAFPNNPLETQDTDNDGVGDNADSFPNDPLETQDTDNDGVGDNADAFPNDPLETQDTDNDGVGDNADAFPNDPLETQDTDDDGVGDNADAFPNDPLETQDTDNDGVGDNADAFPNDPLETQDTDDDGVGDNADAFPNDPLETQDTDNDGVGDNFDIAINNPTIGKNKLIISEVASPYQHYERRWLEIYNHSDEPINLSHYILRTAKINPSQNTHDNFAYFEFPNQNLAPYQHLLVQSAINNANDEIIQAPKQIFLINDNGENPYWNENGFVELIRKDLMLTEDFVRFGTNNVEPYNQNAWKIANNTLETITISGESLARNQFYQDTNQQGDWQSVQFSTPGGPNDVNECQHDEDRDRIPDCAESPERTFNGMPVYSWGARPNQIDLFIEIDYMDSTDDGNRAIDEGLKPHKKALDKVRAVFASKGYMVHFDTGALLSPHYDLGEGNEVSYAQSIHIDPNRNATTIHDYKALNMNVERRMLFYYMLFATTLNENGKPGPGGVAEVVGNDSLITLGGWGLRTTSPLLNNLLINIQAATIMHEFGHNLGLKHGGDDNLNNKPNYLSIMNYMYAINGLPSIGKHEGDRYYFENWHSRLANTLCRDNPQDAYAKEINHLLQGPLSDPNDYRIDFSNGQAQDLDESNIDETKGLGKADSIGVDFNCDGDTDDLSIAIKISPPAEADYEVLTDHDDWGFIETQFETHHDDNHENSPNPKSRNDFLFDDQQKYIIEAPPKQDFLEGIKYL